ncbi:MAG: DHHA1 domain-containing protein [Phycisphaeraceae bacterium]
MTETNQDFPRLDAYTSTLSADQAAAWLLEAGAGGPVSVMTHTKPDGDAFGSVVAVVGTLCALGMEAHGYVVPPIHSGVGRLPGQELVSVVNGTAGGAQVPAEGSLVIVDTGAWSQVGPLAGVVAGRLERTLLIDHHLSGDIPAGARHIDGGAAACCEVLYPILGHCLVSGGLGMPDAVRDGLYAGITSDTGWFRFSNTRPGTLRAAADLVEMGVDSPTLLATLEQSERPEKLALLRRAIGSLELWHDQSVAVMTLRRADFEATGALEEETERFVDVPQQVMTVKVVVLVVEKLEGGGCKLSFRSKPGDDAVNVSELARTFGGGGHARASGARVSVSVEEAVGLLRERVGEVLGRG